MNNRSSGSGAFALIVEDVAELADLLADYLSAADFSVGKIADGRQVVQFVKERMPDVILLDLALPGRGGLEICRELRKFTQVPILIITAKVEEIDRLLGLELGADDYICKPFSPREVVARVKAVLRRFQHGKQPATHGIQIDTVGFRAWVNGKQLDLTPVEFRLLHKLISAPERVFSRQQLMASLYSDHRIVTDRTIDSHIRNLRHKLQQLSPNEEFIESIYGMGYRFSG